MKKQILAATMAVVLISSGAAFAGTQGVGPGKGAADGVRREARGVTRESRMANAPQAIQDAAKQVDIKRSELRLEVAKGNFDAAKMRTLHNDMLKARRTVADYFFEQSLKNPSEAKRMSEGRQGGRGMHYGRGMHGGLFAELRNELRKDNPDTARARQIYGDAMNLMEKQSKERFELNLKYPDSFKSGAGCRF